MTREHEVYVFLLAQSGYDPSYVDELMKSSMEVEILELKRRSKLYHLPGVFLCLLSGYPLETKFVYLKEMRKRLSEILRGRSFDIIQYEPSIMAPYVNDMAENIEAKKILVFHNIGSVQYRRMFDNEKSIDKKIRFLLNWRPLKRWEAKFAGNFDKCFTVSELDKKLLESKNPKLDISVIPNGIDVDNNTILSLDKKNSNNILFIGKMDYEANINAVLFFYKQIFSTLKTDLPGFKFYVVGSNPSPKVRKIGKEKNIVVTGYVNDVRPYYKKCAVTVVPLLAGSGTRLKILESMALGRPVVSTSIGCEGLNVAHKRNILIADNPDEFASSLKELLIDSHLYNQIKKNARRLVEERYSWDKIAKNLTQVYEETVNGR